MTIKKKLIEVALPLDAINEEGSRRKRKAPGGYPTTFHKWWAQRPVAAARGVIFAQMVDDPSAHPDLFPTEKKQEKERQRLFRIIEDLVLWDNTNNEKVLQAARDEIWQSWRSACADNVDHPQAKELFDRHKLPVFHDPFAGSGALPLEAQRLGLETFATDLNPVAVLINKASIEIPPRFDGKPPVNPETQARFAQTGSWKGARGLAEDVRHYGKWVSNEAQVRIGHLYPEVEITQKMAKDRKDLQTLVGKKFPVIAYLWAHTVKSPNPAFAGVDVPLASTYMLSSKEGREAYLEPIIEGGSYRFTVRLGKPKDVEASKRGTKFGTSSFQCLLSGTPLPYEYVDNEANAGRMGARLLAVVTDGVRGRTYLPATPEMEAVARSAVPSWRPDAPARGTWGSNAQGRHYGFRVFGDYFTNRQLVALTTISDLVQEVRLQVERDGVRRGLTDDGTPLREGGVGAAGYSDAVAIYLAVALSRAADYGSALATWRPKDNAMRSSLPNKAIQMAWDFAEGSPFGGSSSGFLECVEVVAKVLETSFNNSTPGRAAQLDATRGDHADARRWVVSTDPPYYYNVAYADLSDFLYVWLRRTLKPVFPDLFATVAAPKADELVATPHRHATKEEAEAYFLEGMTRAVRRLADVTHPAFPVSIYYAFKQAETEGENATASTGWETFLDAVVRAGFAVTGTWPMRTEGDNRQTGIGANALASSIVLVCRPRPASAPVATRREFVAALKSELPGALLHLQRGNIAPVDLAQAAIGPGMAVYTRFAKVVDAGGQSLPVREALALINQALDQVLTEQEGDFDADSRWALAWFEQSGFSEGEYGGAETLSTAKNTSVKGLVEAGILKSSRGKVKLLKPNELPADWDPSTDARLTAWEVVHHLIRALEAGGELGAAALVAKLGSKSEVARELAYRLYTLCERKKRAPEALAYNALVQSWPEITRLAREGSGVRPAKQADLFGKGED